MLSWMSHLIGWSSCADRTLRTCCTDCSHSGWNTGYCKPALNETKKIQHLAGGGAIRSAKSCQLFASCWYQSDFTFKSRFLVHLDHCSIFLSVPSETLQIECLLFVDLVVRRVSKDYQERKQDCQQSPATGTRLQESKQIVPQHNAPNLVVFMISPGVLVFDSLEGTTRNKKSKKSYWKFGGCFWLVLIAFAS